MNLQNNNGFAEISDRNFELCCHYWYDDFDEFMKSEPKYDLKNFMLIESESYI